MLWKTFVAVALLCSFVSSANAVPTMNVVKSGIQGGNFVWEIDIAPDFALAQESTPVAVEVGFRLTGAALISATNINPSAFDTPLPGKIIFGWETPTFPPSFAQGLQINTSTGEVFASFGSADLPISGPIPFLKITALGPGNGGPLSSTIEWRGAYIGMGQISQIVGHTSAQNFPIPNGSATQTVPEPNSLLLLTIGATAFASTARRRQRIRE